MPSFYIDSYTDTSISVCINRSSSYMWYYIIISGNGNTETKIYYGDNEDGEKVYDITGLSSGVEYTIEVKYSNTWGDESTATSLGSRTVTTSGSGSGSGSGGTEPEPEPEPEPDPEPDTDSDGCVYIYGKAYIPYIHNGIKWLPAQAYVHNAVTWKITTI